VNKILHGTWDSSNPGMAERVHETKNAANQSHVLLHPLGPRNSAPKRIGSGDSWII